MTESMTTSEQFSKLLLVTFPVQPEPTRFFWKESVHSNDDEFSRDLSESLAHRQWIKIKTSDWAMIGSSISFSRERLEPTTFLYYLPAMLLSAIDDATYLNWTLA